MITATILRLKAVLDYIIAAQKARLTKKVLDNAEQCSKVLNVRVTKVQEAIVQHERAAEVLCDAHTRKLQNIEVSTDAKCGSLSDQLDNLSIQADKLGAL
jgi:hypothetical protein